MIAQEYNKREVGSKADNTEKVIKHYTLALKIYHLNKALEVFTEGKLPGP